MPIVHSDGRQLKLWAHAIKHLELDDIRREPVRGCLEKFYVEPKEAMTEPLPLGALYVLRDARPSDSPGIEKANVVDAALLLRWQAYRPLLLDRLGQKQHYFCAAAQIAGKSGVFRLIRPLDFAAMADVVSWLERHWRDIGVMEQAA